MAVEKGPLMPSQGHHGPSGVSQGRASVRFWGPVRVPDGWPSREKAAVPVQGATWHRRGRTGWTDQTDLTQTGRSWGLDGLPPV